MEYHKDESDHWSDGDLPCYSSDEDADDLRETMNDEYEDEYDPEEEEKEMLL